MDNLINIKNVFEDSLHNIEKEFQENELAYLALTSKPEGRLRDAISFNLYKKIILLNQNISIDREWNRVDLAVVKENLPLLIAEFKCAYTFDFLVNNPMARKYTYSIVQDLSKSLVYSNKETFIYAILFTVHPLISPNNENIKDIKYSQSIIKSFLTYKDSDILETAKNSIITNFQNWNIKTNLVTINCGTAFQIPVKILAWVVGPFHKHEVSSILEFHK